MIRAEIKREISKAHSIVQENFRAMEKIKESKTIVPYLFDRCEKAIEAENGYGTVVEVERGWGLRGFTMEEQEEIIMNAVFETKKLIEEYGYNVSVDQYTTIPPIARFYISWE